MNYHMNQNTSTTKFVVLVNVPDKIGAWIVVRPSVKVVLSPLLRSDRIDMPIDVCNDTPGCHHMRVQSNVRIQSAIISIVRHITQTHGCTWVIVSADRSAAIKIFEGVDTPIPC